MVGKGGGREGEEGGERMLVWYEMKKKKQTNRACDKNILFGDLQSDTFFFFDSSASANF